MKHKKLFSTLFILVISMLFLGGFNTLIAQGEHVCKITFCNCCKDDSTYFIIYDEFGKYAGEFWTKPSLGGCTQENVFNAVAGSVYWVEGDCKSYSLAPVYFTSCVCSPQGIWWDTIKVPCCDEGDNINSPNIQGNYKVTPKDFMLFQNYPNPFNPITNIRFAITEDSYVKLTIYDVAGREIQTLVNGIMRSGFHDVTWDATNVASGIYFYKIEASGYSDEKKMVIIK